MNDAIFRDPQGRVLYRYNVLLERWDAMKSRPCVTGGNMHGSMLFLSRTCRDVMYRLLVERGENVRRSRTGPCEIHPQYIEDYVGLSREDVGFGNMVYNSRFGNLYALDEVY